MGKIMFLLALNDGLGRATAIGLFPDSEGMLRYEAEHPKGTYEQWIETEYPVMGTGTEAESVKESTAKEIASLRKTLGAANTLIRTLISDNGENPCDWCDAANCEKCGHFEGNINFQCQFAMALN